MASSKNSRNSWRLWVIRSSASCLLAAAFLLTAVARAEARSADYRRAQALVKSDPLEAEALYERFIRETSNDKMRRAAGYDLFFLRLRHRRLVEALVQSRQKQFRRKYNTALSDAYGITNAQAASLARHLRSACAREEQPDRIGSFLRAEHLPAPVWDFALRVLLRCGIEGRSQLIATHLFEAGKVTRLQMALRLIAVREQLYADADKAAKLLAATRAVAEEHFADDEQLELQFILLEARLAAVREEYDAVIERCTELPPGKHATQANAACDLLVTHALLQKGEAAQAWKRIRKVRVNPLDLDKRLLRLVAAVAAGVVEPEKLMRFSRRASYSYCASSLRQLAGSVIEEKIPNKR